jgi:hypothetical protein
VISAAWLDVEHAVSETAVKIVAARIAAALISFCTFVPFLSNGHGLEVLPALALPKSGLTVEDKLVFLSDRLHRTPVYFNGKRKPPTKGQGFSANRL